MQNFPIGSRVELHPGLDLWMRGARFGEVVAHGRTYVRVRLDRTGKIVPFLPSDLEVI